MATICVCIEGQLRGGIRCGKSIKTNLIDPLNAELYFYLQNYDHHDDSNLKYYGDYIEKIVYDNPEPNFEKIFDELADRFGYDKSIWRNTLSELKNRDGNFMLGYESAGTCMRRMYNRYLIYEYFKDKPYEWFILLRSDLCFVDKFYDVSELNKNNLYVGELGGWGGINNNLIVLSKSNLNAILMYIKTFLSGEFLSIVKKKLLGMTRANKKFMKSINEEKFFLFNMEIKNIKIEYLKIKWYISGDDENSYTTWFPFKKAENGDIYKYDYDYDCCREYLNKY